MDTKFKVLDCEIKKVGERSYEFTASTSTEDRDGEVIDAAGWDLKNFKKNPVIMYAHDYRTLPIGRANRVWVSKDGVLKNTVEFPPEGTYEFADIVERLVDTGYLKTESVGFIPRKWEDGDGEKAPRRKYVKQELLEISIVPIPSNPDALRNAVEDGVITTKQFETITKPEETDEFIRLPNPKDDKNHDGHRIRTMDVSKDEGITALYCGECKIIKTYLFNKEEGWTMVKAKKWVADHSKSILILEAEKELPQKAEVSQLGILDELDYVIRLLDTEGMNEEVERDAWNLMRKLMGITGSHIPDDIKELVVKDTAVAVEDTTEEPLTYQDIREAVRRMANKQEEN